MCKILSRLDIQLKLKHFYSQKHITVIYKAAKTAQSLFNKHINISLLSFHHNNAFLLALKYSLIKQ